MKDEQIARLSNLSLDLDSLTIFGRAHVGASGVLTIPSVFRRVAGVR